jgi:hypothetical protein
MKRQRRRRRGPGSVAPPLRARRPLRAPMGLPAPTLTALALLFALCMAVACSVQVAVDHTESNGRQGGSVETIVRGTAAGCVDMKSNPKSLAGHRHREPDPGGPGLTSNSESAQPEDLPVLQPAGGAKITGIQSVTVRYNLNRPQVVQVP